MQMTPGLLPGIDPTKPYSIDANGVVVQSAALRPPGLPLYTTTAAASSGDADGAISSSSGRRLGIRGF